MIAMFLFKLKETFGTVIRTTIMGSVIIWFKKEQAHINFAIEFPLLEIEEEWHFLNAKLTLLNV